MSVVVRDIRTCSRCGLEFPPHEMAKGKVRNGKRYYASWCTSCETARKVNRPVAYAGPERTCATDGCTTKLSRYNHGLYCALCEHERAEAALEANQRREREEVIHIERVTLKPATLPKRVERYGIDWKAVIAEFIESGMDCAEIEAPGKNGKPRSAKLIYQAVRPVIVELKEGRVDVCQRGQKAYLVRRDK